MGNIAVHLFITGKVQGVWYRQSAKEAAERFQVYGWVKNVYDGRVEVFVEGVEEKVAQFIQWCHHGPPMAIVTNVEIFKKEFNGQYKDFSITS